MLKVTIFVYRESGLNYVLILMRVCRSECRNRFSPNSIGILIYEANFFNNGVRGLKLRVIILMRVRRSECRNRRNRKYIGIFKYKVNFFNNGVSGLKLCLKWLLGLFHTYKPNEIPFWDHFFVLSGISFFRWRDLPFPCRGARDFPRNSKFSMGNSFFSCRDLPFPCRRSSRFSAKLKILYGEFIFQLAWFCHFPVEGARDFPRNSKFSMGNSYFSWRDLPFPCRRSSRFSEKLKILYGDFIFQTAWFAISL